VRSRRSKAAVLAVDTLRLRKANVRGARHIQGIRLACRGWIQTVDYPRLRQPKSPRHVCDTVPSYLSTPRRDKRKRLNGTSCVYGKKKRWPPYRPSRLSPARKLLALEGGTWSKDTSRKRVRPLRREEEDSKAARLRGTLCHPSARERWGQKQLAALTS